MTLRSIAIRNKTGVSQAFSIIQAASPPVNDPQNSTCTTILESSPTVSGDGNGRVQFDLTSEYYAFCGTGGEDDSGRLCITVSKALSAKLESNGSKGSKFELSMADSSGSATLTLIDESVSAHGAFSILTDASFSNQYPSNLLYMGVAVKVPHSSTVVPIFATKASPNIQTMFYPAPKYYILPGKFQPGTVISPKEFSNVLTIDFAAVQGNKAEFLF
ncbi:hypothetical protein TrVGV298_008173, partial [Trichoderma virens]